MNRPTIENTEAVFQAGTTVSIYLLAAAEMIDKHMGEGYAFKNPGLVAECVRSQAMDFNCTLIASALWEIKDALSFQIRKLLKL